MSKKFIIVAALTMTAAMQTTNEERWSYFKIATGEMSATELANVKHGEAIKFWVEAGRDLVVYAPDRAKEVWPSEWNAERVPVDAKPEQLYVVQGSQRYDLWQFDATSIVNSGRLVLLQGAMPNALPNHHMRILPFTPNMVLTRMANRDGEHLNGLEYPANIDEMVGKVNGDRWFGAVSKLASWNRYSKGAQIADAQRWLETEMRTLPGFDVTAEEFSVGGVKSYNVIGKIIGTKRPNDIYIVGGHYDSISERPSSTAPGADDNASGAAGVLEMARIFAETPPEATILFVGFSGEEQGLLGSKSFVKKLIARGDKSKVKGVITMDMIGYTLDEELGCLLETSKENQHVIDALAESARRFTKLSITQTYDYWGSDHVPFIDNGMPALLAIEDDYDSYPAYHRTTDLPKNISVELGVEILKMNVATLAAWAL